MRVALLGAAGMLGHDLAATAPPGVVLHPFDRGTDLRAAADVERALRDADPQWVINAAAYTRVDDAETARDEAFAVNAEAVGALATLCAARGCALLHFSTDYVFDGEATRPCSERDATAPLGVYGASKLAGERAIAASGAEWLTLRTQWLFGRHGRSFPATMLARALSRAPTRVVDDQFGRPTFTEDLAAAAWELIRLGARGLLHATSSGPVVSWYDVAAAIFEAAGSPGLLTRCRSADYPTAARRPRYSALDATALEQRLGRALPDWRDALARFLEAEGRAATPGRWPGPGAGAAAGPHLTFRDTRPSR